jgi:Rrf2 family protein
MQVSTRGRYALRAMVDLALHGKDEPVLRRDIAARQEISADYVAQLFRQLRMAGLVEGVKGPGGGYQLARDPATISAGDVVRAVEGPIAVTSCARLDEDPRCPRVEDCVTRAVWLEVSQAVAHVLDSITLQRLRDQAQGSVQAEE